MNSHTSSSGGAALQIFDLNRPRFSALPKNWNPSGIPTFSDDRVEHRLVRPVAHLHDAPGGRVIVVHNDATGAVVVVPRSLLFSYLCRFPVENRHHALIAFPARALVPADAGHNHAALAVGFLQRLAAVPRQSGRRELLVDEVLRTEAADAWTASGW